MNFSVEILRDRTQASHEANHLPASDTFIHTLGFSEYQIRISCTPKNRITYWTHEKKCFFLIGYTSDNKENITSVSSKQDTLAMSPEALKKISGNYLLIITDSQSEKILVSCDVCAVVPFYWCIVNGELVASSDAHTLTRVVSSRELDEENFFRGLVSLPLRPNSSFFKNIHKLHALSLLSINLAEPDLAVQICSTTNETLFFKPDRQTIDESGQIHSLAENLQRSASSINAQGSILTQLSSGLDSANTWAAIQSDSRASSLAIYTGLFAQTDIEDQEIIQQWLGMTPAGTRIHTDDNVIRNIVSAFTRLLQQKSINFPANSHTTFPAIRTVLRSEDRYAVVTGEGGDELFALGPQVLFELLFTGKLSDISKFFRLRDQIMNNYDYSPSQRKSLLGLRGLSRTRGKLHQILRNRFIRPVDFAGLSKTHQKRLFEYSLDYEPRKRIFMPWQITEYSLLSNLKVIQDSFWMEKEYYRANHYGFDVYHPLLEYATIDLVARGRGHYLWENGYRKKPLYESLKLLKPDFNYQSRHKGSHFDYYQHLLKGSNGLLGEYHTWELVRQGYLDAGVMNRIFDTIEFQGYKFHVIPFELFLRSFR